MTDQELMPFVGKKVAVHHNAGHVVTGKLVRSDPDGPYEVHSIDGEVPPTAFLREEIDGIDA